MVFASMNRFGFLWVYAPALAVQVLVLAIWGESPLAVIHLFILLECALLGVLIGMLFLARRAPAPIE